MGWSRQGCNEEGVSICVVCFSPTTHPGSPGWQTQRCVGQTFTYASFPVPLLWCWCKAGEETNSELLRSVAVCCPLCSFREGALLHALAVTHLCHALLAVALFWA